MAGAADVAVPPQISPTDVERQNAITSGSGLVKAPKSVHAGPRTVSACQVCNKRKTKCDIATTGIPCSRCRSNGESCIIRESKRGKYDRSKSKARSLSNKPTTNDDTSPSPLNATDAGQNHISPSMIHTFTLPNLDFAFSGPTASMPIGSELLANANHPGIHNASSGIPQIPTALTLLSEAAQDPLMPVFAHPQPSANAAADVLCSPRHDRRQITANVAAAPEISSDAWVKLMNPADKLAAQQQELVYMPDTFTLAHALRRYWKRASIGEVPTERVHFLLPIAAGGDICSQIELDYLTTKGCFTLPPKAVLDKMFAAYFEHFHPIYPVIDRLQFYDQYEKIQQGAISPLKLWGMLYVASTLCDFQDLQNAGITDRFAALRSFAQRGKALYACDYERDKIMIVLFEFLIGSVSSEGEDSHVWATRACGTAQSLGMHRSTANSQLSPSERSSYRRLYWSVFIRDRHSAMGTGRPPHLFDGIYDDVEPPQVEDFENLEQYEHFEQAVKLAKILIDVAHCAVGVSGEHRHVIQAGTELAMRNWLFELPRNLAPDNPTRSRLCIHLHLSYHCWLIHLCRKSTDSTESSPVAAQSAAVATRLFEDLFVEGCAGQLPQFGVTCLFAVMSQHLVDMQSSNMAVRALSRHRLDTCRMVAREIAVMRPVAAWFRRIFRVFDNNTPVVDDGLEPPMPMSQNNAMPSANHVERDASMVTFHPDIVTNISGWSGFSQASLDNIFLSGEPDHTKETNLAWLEDLLGMTS